MSSACTNFSPRRPAREAARASLLATCLQLGHRRGDRGDALTLRPTRSRVVFLRLSLSLYPSRFASRFRSVCPPPRRVFCFFKPLFVRSANHFSETQVLCRVLSIASCQTPTVLRRVVGFVVVVVAVAVVVVAAASSTRLALLSHRGCLHITPEEEDG